MKPDDCSPRAFIVAPLRISLSSNSERAVKGHPSTARMRADPNDPVIRDHTTRHPARFERLIAVTVLLLLLLGSLVVLWPFLFALAWALVMAFALWPLQRRLPAGLRRRKTVAALAMTSAIAL